MSDFEGRILVNSKNPKNLRMQNNQIYQFAEIEVGRRIQLRGSCAICGVVQGRTARSARTEQSAQIEGLRRSKKFFLSREQMNCVEDVVVTGAEERQIDCTQDALNILKLGFDNRKVGGTAMNQHSSRSHAIFIMNVSV